MFLQDSELHTWGRNFGTCGYGITTNYHDLNFPSLLDLQVYYSMFSFFLSLVAVGPLIFQRRTSLYGWSTWVSLLVLFGLFAEGIRCLCLGKYHQEDYGGMSGGGSDGDLTMVPRPCKHALGRTIGSKFTSDITMDSCEKLFDAVM